MKAVNLFILFAFATLMIVSCKKKESTAPVKPVVGLVYEGGIIFYVDGTGEHGLIAASSDMSFSADWGCSGVLCGASDTTISSGSQNTSAIIGNCDSTGIAAQLCKSYSSGGYTGWFLPSKNELNLMYTNLYKQSIGSFTSNYYWSSSEYDANNAWFQYFGTGFQEKYGKSYQFHVRAERAF